MVKILRPTLDAHGYAEVKLQGPDDWGNDHNWSMVDALEKNPEANRILQAVGYHYANDYLPQLESERTCPSEKVIATGKPLWDSEEFTVSGKTWEKSLLLAQCYNKNYIRSRITKTEVWPMLSGIYPGIAYSGVGLMAAHTPWSGHYDVYPAVWTTAHTTQFAEPGWRYMDKACAKIDPTTWAGSHVALRDPQTGNWSLIVCTGRPTDVQVQVAGKLAKSEVHVWKSTDKIQFVEEKTIRPTDSSFTISLEGNCVYTLSTTTGQKKGAHPTPPPAADFPLPYKDDFEGYPAGVTPKYTSDQKGTFETAKRAEGKGICLKQIIPKEGIPWGARGGFPNTPFGDVRWINYTVQADVLVTSGRAGIGARYIAWDRLGFNFALHEDGTWSLDVPNRTNGQDVVKVLATGKVEGFTPGKWHHLALTLKGSEVCASLDGNEVTRVQNEGHPDHKSGMAYLMSSYDSNCFDNISVTP